MLYFDEPTVGIDPDGRIEILKTIRAFKHEARTVIYCSHYLSEIEKICDQAAIIDHGRIILEGRIETLLRERGTSTLHIEMFHADKNRLQHFARHHSGLEVADAATLTLAKPNASTLADLLEALENEGFELKEIRYGSTTLEDLFLRLTTTGEKRDV